MNFEDGSHNPYTILGLPFGADFDLVKAMYKSMVKIYHPDVFVGDKKFAVQRLIELNAAFEFLSETQQKKTYDESSNSKKTENNADFDETDSSFDDETSSLMESWKFACEYHPEIQAFYNELKKLNKRPAFAFMAILVEQKLYADAKKIAKYLENEFLTSAFGDDKAVKAIGKSALLANERKYALELNHTLKKLGYSSVEQILTKLLLKYPDFGYEALDASSKYQHLIRAAGVYKGSQKDKPFKKRDAPSKKEGGSDFLTWMKSFLKVVLIFIFCYAMIGVALGMIVVVFPIQRSDLLGVAVFPLSILSTYLINKKLRGEDPLGNLKKIDLTERKLFLPILIIPNLVPLFTYDKFIYLDLWALGGAIALTVLMYRYRMLKLALGLPIFCYIFNMFFFYAFGVLELAPIIVISRIISTIF